MLIPVPGPAVALVETGCQFSPPPETLTVGAQTSPDLLSSASSSGSKSKSSKSSKKSGHSSKKTSLGRQDSKTDKEILKSSDENKPEQEKGLEDDGHIISNVTQEHKKERIHDYSDEDTSKSISDDKGIKLKEDEEDDDKTETMETLLSLIHI